MAKRKQMNQVETNKQCGGYRHELLSGMSHAWLDKINNIMGQLPDDLTGKTVLDVGCGEGYFTVLCALRGAKVTALDLDKQAIDSTIELCSLYEVVECVNFMVGDIEQFCATNSFRFDYVLCLDCLEHTECPAEILRSIISIGDMIILQLPNGLYFSHLFNEPSVRDGHRWFFTPKAGHQLISKSGGDGVWVTDMISPHLVYVISDRVGIVVDGSWGFVVSVWFLFPSIILYQVLKYYFWDKRLSSVTFDDIAEKNKTMVVN